MPPTTPLMYLVETDRSSVPVEDLGLVLRVGVETWVSPEEYEASDCLRSLERLGKVRVSSHQRSRTVKDPAPKSRVPPSMRLSRPRSDGMAPVLQKSVEPAPEAPRGPTSDEIQAMISSAAREAAAQAASAVAQHFMSLPQVAPVPADHTGLEERIEAAVSRAVGAAMAEAPQGGRGYQEISPPPSWKPEEPLYIPSNLTGGDTTPALGLGSSTTSAGSVDDAAGALKKLRKKPS